MRTQNLAPINPSSAAMRPTPSAAQFLSGLRDPVAGRLDPARFESGKLRSGKLAEEVAMEENGKHRWVVTTQVAPT